MCSQPGPNTAAVGPVPFSRSILAVSTGRPSAIGFLISHLCRTRRCTGTNPTNRSPAKRVSTISRAKYREIFRAMQRRIRMKRAGEKYLASRIDLFLQTGRARRLHALYFLDEGHVGTSFTTHPILEPPCPQLHPHPTRGGTLRPVAPIGCFAESIVINTGQRANTVVRVLLASEIDFSNVYIRSNLSRKII